MSNYFYDLPIELQTYIIHIKSANSIRNSWYKFYNVKYALFITLNALCDKWPLSHKQSEIIHMINSYSPNWDYEDLLYACLFNINKNMSNTWGKREFEIMHNALVRASKMRSSIPIRGWNKLLYSLKNIVNFEITKIHDLRNANSPNWDYEDLLYACLFNINYIHIEFFPNLEIS